MWLRRAVSSAYPTLFKTVLVPKEEELVATPFRFDGDRIKARTFFERNLAIAFNNVRQIGNDAYPIVVYYAFKQSESDTISDSPSGSSAANASTGWETMLEGLINAGFTITGTWSAAHGHRMP